MNAMTLTVNLASMVLRFGRTIQIRNNFVLFVKIVMGHRIVDLGQLDGFMGVAFDTYLIQ
jgi:hypothetical protein